MSPAVFVRDVEVAVPQVVADRELVYSHLREHRPRRYGAAAKLGIPRSTLDLKIKQLNIKKHTNR
ncbi:MAG TPA: hypothetical protein VOA41_11355 [Candidatus Dormibacteraeota bacterium]|nr:hypothetical protein [Candidatus Dormibacteraeota bacterium]